jgi:hypothetical protein
MARYNKTTLQSQNFSAPLNAAGADFVLLGPILDAAGAPIDLSAANAIQISYFLPSGNRGAVSAIGSQSALTGDSSGNVEIPITGALSAVSAHGVGSFPFLLKAKDTSGDTLQDLMQGLMSVSWP